MNIGTHLIIGISAFILLTGIFYFVYDKGYERCQSEIIQKNAKVKEDLNEIRNIPISDDDLFVSLRNGTF